MSGLWHVFSRVSLCGIRWTSPNAYLAKYKDACSNYVKDELKALPDTKYDNYEMILTTKGNDDLLEKMGHELWKFNVFPPSVMITYGTFDNENRFMMKGDLVFERVQLIPHILETYAINIIEGVIDEPKKKGFILDSTAVHDEKGSLECFVELRTNGEIILNMSAITYLNHPLVRNTPIRWYPRYLQKRAHGRAFENLQQLCKHYANSKE